MILPVILAASLQIGVCWAWLRAEERHRRIRRDNHLIDRLGRGEMPTYPDMTEFLLAAWVKGVRR